MFDFEPSQEILEMICQDGETPIRQYFVYPTDIEEDRWEEQARSLASGLINRVAEFYMWGLKVKEGNFGILGFAQEAISNGIAHGTGSYVVHGLFLGSNGVCHGFWDGGEYFTREDVKGWYEGKQDLPEKSAKKSPLSGYGAGVEACIYKFSDHIEVDINDGILYCVQLRTSLEK